MKQKVIRYKNPFTGEDVEKEYYFSLSRAEIAKMKLAHRGDIVEYFNEIVENKDGAELIEVYENLLLKSVAVRDGDNLIKTPELIQQFTGSGAYEELFMELIQSEDAGLSFFTEVFPEGLMEEAQAKQAEQKQPTDEELLAMSDAEFEKFAGPFGQWSKHTTAIAMKRKTRAA